MRKTILALNISALSALGASTLQAQEASGFALEEVVVTAQKRQQSLQDIPVSAQAFNAEDIRVMGADSVSELMFAAPSLNAGGLGGSQQRMGIRGIIDYSRNPGVDPRMGIYIDEVYQGQGYSADQPLLGLANVEILRGPQGTLFGKNTVSGAINLVTKQPTEEFEGEIALTYGNEGQIKAQTYLSGGLTDNLFGSLSVAYDERDGLFTNTFLNKEVGDYDRISTRGKLHWVATDALAFTLSMDYTKRDSTEPFGTLVDLPAFETQANQESDDSIEFWGVGLRTTYALDSGYELISITSYRDAQFEAVTDDDQLPQNLQASFFDEDNGQFTQEFRIQSPAEGDFTWLAGLYYFESERSTGRSSQIGEELVGPLWGVATTPISVDNTSYAAFFHADWVLTDRLSMTFGVRYNEGKKKIDWSQINENKSGLPPSVPVAPGILLGDTPGILFGLLEGETKETHKEDSTSPMIALNYQLNDDTLIYGRYSNAAKAGGFNAEFMLDFGNMDLFEHDQETVDAYELGLKTTLLEDTVRLNLAVFEMNFEDYQYQGRIDHPRGLDSQLLVMANAAEVTVEGIEAELTWVPIDNLRVTANATWLDAGYDEFTIGGSATDFSGNPLIYAPELKYFIGVQYLAQLGNGSLIFDVDYSSVGEQYTDADKLERNLIADYSLANARIAYTPSGGDWELAFWGRNLGDEDYRRLNAMSFTGTQLTVYGDPRLYGATFTYFLGQ